MQGQEDTQRHACTLCLVRCNSGVRFAQVWEDKTTLNQKLAWPAAPGKGGPAAPPPPPPGSLFQPKGPAPAPAKPSSGMSAIFSEINKVYTS